MAKLSIPSFTRALVILAAVTYPLFPLSASEATAIARTNATILAGGPSDNPWFHNAQSSGNFTSYAVANFTFGPSDFTRFSSMQSVEKMEIKYTQALAPFTREGPIEWFITFDPAVAGGDFSGLTHSGQGNGIQNKQFKDHPGEQSLGKNHFRPGLDGDVDSFALQPGPDLSREILNHIRQGTPFGIILTAPSTPGMRTAATYAGVENRSHPNQIRLKLTLSTETAR